MKWKNRQGSSNIEDRRGSGGGGRLGGSLIGAVVVLVGAFFGLDLTGVVNFYDSAVAPAVSGPQSPVSESAEEKELRNFVSVVLKETEDAWGEIFAQAGMRYVQPKLVLYRGATDTACGMGRSAMGPFYCPADQKVYLDLSFYDDMRNKLQADGEFAMAYVVAHEVGHHAQNLLGISRQVRKAQSASSEAESNRLSVKLELQADCFAGIWARKVKDKSLLDPGDAQQAFNAAEAVGDDRLQRRATGAVVLDSFTHGSSAQRLEWFKRGLASGSVGACDTFN